MTLERLRELAKAGKRWEGENLGEFCDRWHSEDREIREALPDLLEIADAAWQALFVESKQMQDWTEEDIALYAALSQVMLDEKEG